jgi:SAM-dependent methyltransferase
MKRVHIPNLFFIQGQAHQGKSSLTRHFRRTLDCEVLPTDQIFWRWCDKYHPKETKDVRVSLGRYFPYLSTELRREWFEYLTNYTLSVTKYARPDMVIEGWLLTLLPKDLKEVLHSRCSIMNVTMRHFAAHASKRVFQPTGRDYNKVVDALQERMRIDKEAELMPKVRYQRYEDCRHCPGRSDSQGRLAAFGLPEDLSGKSVLEIGCQTGYFGIRLAQRGAKVYAVDANPGAVQLASRIANAVYRLPSIRFYHGNILTEDFRNSPKFDYVLAVNGLAGLEDPVQLFKRVDSLLKPDGVFLLEATVPRLDSGNPDRDKAPFFKEIKIKNDVLRYPNDKTVQTWAQGFSLQQRVRSVPPGNSLLARVAYTYTKGEVNGLGNGVNNDSSNHSDRAENSVGLVASAIEPGMLDLPDHHEGDVRPPTDHVDDHDSQYTELSKLEERCAD